MGIKYPTRIVLHPPVPELIPTWHVCTNTITKFHGITYILLKNKNVFDAMTHQVSRFQFSFITLTHWYVKIWYPHKTGQYPCPGHSLLGPPNRYWYEKFQHTCQCRQERGSCWVSPPEIAACFQVVPLVKERHGMEVQWVSCQFGHGEQVHFQPFCKSQSA
jgi:hypothetical protein